MSNVEHMAGLAYQGPATLTAGDREYAVGVNIRVELHQDFDHEGKVIFSYRSWSAEIDGRTMPPPRGECALQLPDGRQGKAVVADIRASGESDIWTGRLGGQGPSPTALDLA